MPSTEDIYGGKFLSAVLVKSEKLVGKPLTITNVEAQEIGMGENIKTKLVVSFNETEKQLVLNKTNCGTIAESYSTDYTTWIGKKIFLQLVKRQFQGQLLEAVSVAIVATPSPSIFVKTEKMMQCIQCNSTYAENQSFCSNCGEKICSSCE